MPRHEQISPEEDLGSFYGGTPPKGDASAPPPVPTTSGSEAAPAPGSEAAPAVEAAPAAAPPQDVGASQPPPSQPTPPARPVGTPLGANPTVVPEAYTTPFDEPPPPAGPRVAPVQRPMPTFPPPAAATPAGQPVSSVLAALISAILPGAGQIYAGQTVKGVVLLVLAFFTCMGGGVFNILAAIDAYLIAERRAKGENVGEWQFF